MCGITGKIYFGKENITLEDIEKMNSAIIHRGPDDGGIYISPNSKLGLGHRRLSVIDLSSLGHQPMRYLDRYQIVFNGEIYNFKDKRETLRKEGYIFQTKTDTEVILALYAKYGKGCLQHLRGMFAFAIYDEKGNTLFCARDRIGKKPFKYYLDQNVFIFASELKAILTQKEYHKEPDYTAIYHYLTFQYCPAPLTGFKNIQKLEPAHYLFINLANRQMEKKCYWKLNYSPQLNLSEKEWKKRILEKLEESIKLRMISDVPLGAFLSGGIDSGAIVGIMSKLSGNPIKTFSIGFREKKYNELPYAKIVAQKFKTEHTEFIVEPNVLEILPFIVKQFEEPFADSSAIPTYYLSKLTKEYVTVALSGDGGDENFAGYWRHSFQKISLYYGKYFYYLNKFFANPALKLLARNFSSDLIQKAAEFSSLSNQNYQLGYARLIFRHFPHLDKFDALSDNFKKQFAKELSEKIITNQFDRSGTNNKLDQMLYADFITYLPDDLMTKVDIASMAVALETRSPFLDHELMELCAQIPFSLKIKGFFNRKYILKKALKDILPDEILNRPKKGFELPVKLWLRNELKDYAYEKLLSEKASSRNIFDRNKIKMILDTHNNSSIDFSGRIWTMLMLENWFEEYFD